LHQVRWITCARNPALFDRYHLASSRSVERCPFRSFGVDSTLGLVRNAEIPTEGGIAFMRSKGLVISLDHIPGFSWWKWQRYFCLFGRQRQNGCVVFSVTVGRNNHLLGGRVQSDRSGQRRWQTTMVESVSHLQTKLGAGERQAVCAQV